LGVPPGGLQRLLLQDAIGATLIDPCFCKMAYDARTDTAMILCGRVFLRRADARPWSLDPYHVDSTASQ
jgi:hypothetical protein